MPVIRTANSSSNRAPSSLPVWVLAGGIAMFGTAMLVTLLVPSEEPTQIAQASRIDDAVRTVGESVVMPAELAEQDDPSKADTENVRELVPPASSHTPLSRDTGSQSDAVEPANLAQDRARAEDAQPRVEDASARTASTSEQNLPARVSAGEEPHSTPEPNPVPSVVAELPVLAPKDTRAESLVPPAPIRRESVEPKHSEPKPTESNDIGEPARAHPGPKNTTPLQSKPTRAQPVREKAHLQVATTVPSTNFVPPLPPVSSAAVPLPPALSAATMQEPAAAPEPLISRPPTPSEPGAAAQLAPGPTPLKARGSTRQPKPATGEFTLLAVAPDRIWVRVNNQRTVLLATGQELEGYGRLVRIESNRAVFDKGALRLP